MLRCPKALRETRCHVEALLGASWTKFNRKNSCQTVQLCLGNHGRPTKAQYHVILSLEARNRMLRIVRPHQNLVRNNEALPQNMKVGPENIRARAPTLPLEVIILILSFVTCWAPDLERQTTLWTCCLISKIWHQATIADLYCQPVLSNRNFDRFVRTICPRSGSRMRQTGLEDLVKDLNMGGLAYESSKSQTARLLRRCSRNLECFVGPAVSFS